MTDNEDCKGALNRTERNTAFNPTSSYRKYLQALGAGCSSFAFVVVHQLLRGSLDTSRLRQHLVTTPPRRLHNSTVNSRKTFIVTISYDDTDTEGPCHCPASHFPTRVPHRCTYRAGWNILVLCRSAISTTAMERQISSLDMWYWAFGSSDRTSVRSRCNDFVYRNLCRHPRWEHCGVLGS